MCRSTSASGWTHRRWRSPWSLRRSTGVYSDSRRRCRLRARKPSTRSKRKAAAAAAAGPPVRLRSGLVIAQVAVCLVLLVGATLFLRSFIAAQSLSPGFDADRLVTASMDMFPSGYSGERIAISSGGAEVGAGAARRRVGGIWLPHSPRLRRQQFDHRSGRWLLASRERNRHHLHHMATTSRRWASRSVPGREYDGTDTATSPRTRRDQRIDGAPLLAGRKRGRQDSRFGPNANEVIGVVADTKHNSINERRCRSCSSRWRGAR